MGTQGFESRALRAPEPQSVDPGSSITLLDAATAVV